MLNLKKMVPMNLFIPNRNRVIGIEYKLMVIGGKDKLGYWD